MRWLLVPLLAACSSTSGWNIERVSDATRPALLRELRNPFGDATVVVGDRCYYVPDPAAQREIHAFTTVLADAVESQAPLEAESPPPPGAGIVGIPWTSEAISMTTMGAEMVRTDQGTVIHAWGLHEPDSWIVAHVHGTEATAAAWAKLAATVRDQATTWVWGPTYLLVGRGFDVRGNGGHALRE